MNDTHAHTVRCSPRGGGQHPSGGRAGAGIARAIDGRLAIHRRRAAGFSLLEVLVAFVILALVATSLFRLFAGSLANVGAADEYSRAVLVAESVLAEVGSAKPLREGTRSGRVEDGRIEWTASVAPWVAPDVLPELERASEALPMRLYRIAVEVSFPSPAGGQRTFALATTRIGPRESL